MRLSKNSRSRSTPSAPPQLESLEAREVPAYLGELDPTFGTGGLAEAPAAINVPGYPAATVDSSGRTIVLTNYNQGLTVIRFNANGSLDTTFGNDGSASAFSGFIPAAGVAVDAAGDIVVLGQIGAGDGPNGQPEVEELAVARFTPSGTLDTSFGNGGTLEISAPAGYADFRAGNLAIDANGNIVIAGGVSTNSTTPPTLAVLRLTPSGTPDPTFNGGQVELESGDNAGSYVEAVTLDAAGRILIAGQAGVFGAAVVRLNPNGGLDTSFNGIGFASVPGPSTPITAITTDPAGDVYLGGPFNGQAAFVKLTEAGTVDTTFGTGGVVQDPISPIGFGPYETIRGLAVTASGDLIAVVEGGSSTGSLTSPSTDQLTVLDLNPDGTLDPDFNAAGPLPGTNTIDFGDSLDRLIGVNLTPTGDIILTGFSGGTSVNLEVAKLIGTGPGRPVGSGSGGTGGGSNTPADPFADLGVPVQAARGDVNGDGVVDTIFVTGPGTPLRVAVVSGTDGTTILVPPFDPFGGDFTGGGTVIAADFDHSGRDQIVIAADVGGGPRVVIWSLTPDGQLTQDASFFGITGDPNFRGGVRIAAGDVNDDGTPDLVVLAGAGGGPRVAVFDGTTLLSGTPTKLVNDFFAFSGTDEMALRTGAYVAVGDVNGDGYADLIFGSAPGAGVQVLVISGKALIQDGPAAAALTDFQPGGAATSSTGVAVAVTTAANDGVADVAVGPAPGTTPVVTEPPSAQVPVYAGSTLTADTTPPAPALMIDPTTDIVLSGVFVG